MILSVTMALFQTLGSDLLVVDGFALGVRTEQGWSAPRPAPQPITIGLTQVKLGDVATSNVALTMGPNHGSSTTVALNPAPVGVFYSGKVWLPRPGKNSIDRSLAMAAAARFARDRKVLNPRPYLLRVWEVDLDGSGKTVQIISAQSRPLANSPARPGDWEAVILRQTGQVQDRIYPLAFSFPGVGETLAQCRLRAVADFDGDGNMEIVTTSKQSMYLNATLWSFRDGKPKATLDATFETSP